MHVRVAERIGFYGVAQGQCQSQGADPADKHGANNNNFTGSRKPVGDAHGQTDGCEGRNLFKGQLHDFFVGIGNRKQENGNGIVSDRKHQNRKGFSDQIVRGYFAGQS